MPKESFERLGEETLHVTAREINARVKHKSMKYILLIRYSYTDLLTLSTTVTFGT